MKQLLLIFLFLFSVRHCFCQPVVFCPKGAEWHYLFSKFAFPPTNEEVKYIKDSIIGLDTFKVLKHKTNKYYLKDNHVPGSNGLTIIKQKGDTIFFKNYLTQNSWQILYNFGAQPGESWKTTIITTNGVSAPVYVTYSYTVSSVSSVNINSVNLRVLSLTYTLEMPWWPNPGLTPLQGSTQITERFGGNTFMFHYFNQRWGSEGDQLIYFLCYQDDKLGLKQFTNFDCLYSADVGLDEVSGMQKIATFPNPAHNYINLTVIDPASDLLLYFTDISGREVKKMKLEAGNNKHVIDVQDLNTGMYMVSVMKEQEVIYTGKLIKEE